tara:strand:- start:2193 stop:3176 length:984 start_codon:yes stop_codon:yes gene_type:complete
MSSYKNTDHSTWTGRSTGQHLYLHEKVILSELEKVEPVLASEKSYALLGYACEDGVKRNQGRIGASQGPDAIRRALAKLPNHLAEETQLLDVGTILSMTGNMEEAQDQLSIAVSKLLEKNLFPILLGGGHDMAYGHYNGIKNKFGKKATIGIINFDAHFDLRSNENGNNSGTPFYQIATDCQTDGTLFNYLCLGIRKDANDRVLFQTAHQLKVRYIDNERFNLHYLAAIKRTLHSFIDSVDHIYTTIDLDGFSSAYAPGVSAPAPMGFSPDIVLQCLQLIINTKKLRSFDIAEMNPDYDSDSQTAKLAAGLIHSVIHGASKITPSII